MCFLARFDKQAFEGSMRIFDSGAEHLMTGARG